MIRALHEQGNLCDQHGSQLLKLRASGMAYDGNLLYL